MKCYIFFLLFIAGCIGGCSLKAGPEEGLEKAPEEKIRLTVLAGQSTSDAGIEDMIDEALKEKFPDVVLEWECIDWGENFDSQIGARFAAGDIPDIMIGKAQDIANYHLSGNIAPIPEKCCKKVKEEALQSVMEDGIVYGLPYNAFYQGVIYNKKIFQKYGFSVPKTYEELEDIIRILQNDKIVPFASHFRESWKVGNMTMQFMTNEIFKDNLTWGDEFRKGKTNYTGNEAVETCLKQNEIIKNATWDDAMMLEQYESDVRFAEGKAAMYVSGLWSMQFAYQYEGNHLFGIFPYPNKEGNSCLIRETNMTIMKSASTEHSQLIDDILYELVTNEKLVNEILQFTQTESILKEIRTPDKNTLQEDIDWYERNGKVIEASVGNHQLLWPFQNEVAAEQLEWLNGNIALEEVLRFADEHRAASGT